MKRFLVIAALIILTSSPVFGLSAFEEESWLGAAVFKTNLSAVERYSPFVDIRNQNYNIFQAGNTVRTVFADYILVQQFKTIKELESTLKKNLGAAAVTLELKNNFAKITSATEYNQKMYELKSIAILKNEVAVRKNFLKTYLGNQWYEKFYYDFYHLKVIKSETSTPVNEQWSLSPVLMTNPASRVGILNAREEYLKGAYITKIVVKDGALSESVALTEKLNQMIPIYPQSIINSNSPLVSRQEIETDTEYKKKMLNQFGAKIRFIWISKVYLLTISFNKEYLEEIEAFFNLFSDDNLAVLNGLYKNKFGQCNYELYNANNLTSLLKNQIKVN